MVTKKELLQAIQECESEPTTMAKVSKLADFYIIYDHLFGTSNYETERSTSAGEPEETIRVAGDSEFLRMVNGKKAEKVWSVIDELVSVIQVINPRLYNGVIRKLDE